MGKENMVSKYMVQYYFFIKKGEMEWMAFTKIS